MSMKLKAISVYMILLCIILPLGCNGEILTINTENFSENDWLQLHYFPTTEEMYSRLLEINPQYKNAYILYKATLSDSIEGYDVTVIWYNEATGLFEITDYNLVGEGWSIAEYQSSVEELTVQEYMSYALNNSKIHNATAMWEKYWGPWQFWSWETKMAFLEQYHSMPAEASEKPIHIGSPHPGYSLPTSSYYTQEEVLDLLHESLKTTYGLTDEQIALLGEDVRFIETDEGGNWQIYHWIYIENQNEVFLVPIMMSIVVPPHTISEGSGIDTNCVTMFMMYEDYLPLLFKQ